MKYKLIALDLDGTLCNDSKDITPKTVEALKNAQKQGVTVALASARPIPGLFKQMRILDLEAHHGLLMGYNGGKIVDTNGMKTLYEKEIPKDLAPKLLEHLKDFPVTPIIDDGKIFYVTDQTAYKVEHECWNNQMTCIEVPSLIDALNFDIIKVLMSVQPDILYDVLATIGKPFENELDFVRTAPFYIEAMPKGINKGFGLNHICEALNISPEEVIAFGDAENDLEMIQFAGCGVAMENACDSLKNAANKITRSNNDDGIAYMLDELL